MNVSLQCASREYAPGERGFGWGEDADLSALPVAGDVLVIDACADSDPPSRYRVLEVEQAVTPIVRLAPLYNIVDRADGALVRDHRLWADGRWTTPGVRRDVGEWTLTEWRAVEGRLSAFQLAFVPAHA